jgi:flagellar motor switch protein FliG
MDTDRLGQTSGRLTRRVQGLTGGHWAIVTVLAGLAIVGGWAWTSWPAEDSDPWITLSVTRTADGSGPETSVAGDPRAISTALDDAGLDGYRFQGNSLQVKASQVERTLATLERTAAPEDKWTARWEDQVGQLGAFSTTAQYEQAREIALRKEIRQLLKAVPEIAEVQVLLARSRAPRSFGSRGRRVTATIGIKPRPGIQLTDDQIETLRQVVAGGVPDLAAQDVVIFDQSALTDSSPGLPSPTVAVADAVSRGQQPESLAAAPGVEPPTSINQPAWLLPLIACSSLVGLVLIVTSLRRRDPVADVLNQEHLLATWLDEVGEVGEVGEAGEVVPEASADEELDAESDTEAGSDGVETAAEATAGEPDADLPERDAGESRESSAGRLAFLANAEPALLGGWLTEEHPQVAAVIVAELPEAFRGEVLASLGGELRADLEARLAGGVEVHEDVLIDLAETLRDRWRDAESRLLEDTVVRDKSLPSAPPHGFSNSEVALLQAVEGILSRFDDLIGVDASIIRAVYDLVGPHPFRQALSGSDIEIRRTVLNRLAPLARMELARQIDQQDPVRLADIQRSQHEILKHTRRLLAAADPSWLAEEA